MLLIKRTQLFCFLLASVCQYSCKKENFQSAIIAEFNKPFKLRFNEQSYLSNDSRTLTVTVKNITDERCFSENGCDHDGTASVRLYLSNLKSASGETILSISNSRQTDSTLITIGDNPYLIKLLEIDNSDKQPDLMATIVVRPLE